MALNILIADDSWPRPNIADVIAKNLNSKYRDNRVYCKAVYDGNEAIKAFQHEIFDIVVLDYNMPTLNGYETAKELRRISPNVRLIGFSSSWYPHEADEVRLEYSSSIPDHIEQYIDGIISKN